MDNNQFFAPTGADKLKHPIVWLLIVALAGAIGWLTGVLPKGQIIPFALIVVPIGIAVVSYVVINPRKGLILYLFYCFIVNGVNRYLPGVFQFGLLMEGILVLIWIGFIFKKFRQTSWAPMNNGMVKMALFWLFFNLAEIFNPSGATISGWFYESRTAALAWVLVTPLVYVLWSERKDITLFINLVIGFALLGALWGFKQKFIGVDSMESRWLAAGAHTTHVLFGKLRIFSFYSDAGQFGCSQAMVSVMAGIVALGPFSWKKKLLFGGLAFVLFYSHLVAGTRTALFVFVPSTALFLILTKRLEILLLGALLAGGAFYTLKYTTIGEGNDEIRRLRTALDPKDKSLQSRFRNQEKLAEYLSVRPFGAGVGVIGNVGTKYNPNHYVSTIPPDSLWVKQWAQYGIVGLLIWLGMMGYIIGYGAGVIWNLRDVQLQYEMMAIVCGFAGVLFASYGQEILNLMPTTAIVSLGIGFIWLGAKWDSEKALG